METHVLYLLHLGRLAELGIGDVYADPRPEATWRR
jgi:hypothetical protein